MRTRSAALIAVVGAVALIIGLGIAWTGARQTAPRELDAVDILRTSEPESRPEANDLTLPATTNAGAVASAAQRAGLAEETRLDGNVSVVFDDDARPAAGADIYWFGSEQLLGQRWRDDLDELGMGQNFCERNGRHFVSDANGAARVPSSAGRIQIVAMTHTHFGMATLTRPAVSAEVIALRLRAAFGVDVRVLGATSRAPARDVVVVASCTQLPESRVGARSDERGIARLFPLFHEDDPSGNWYAGLPGVFFEEQRAALPMQKRSEPLELLLPESAPAVVRIVDKQGELCALSGKLLIGWKDREGDSVDPREVRITDGIANLTRIESGLSLHVQARLHGTPEAPTAIFTLGATKSGGASFDLILEQKPTAKRD